ncbi:MAG: glycosyltransferase, partial [Clostridiales bacterium]|nr:glycosyltransferase [Clostridiales bacterium]
MKKIAILVPQLAGGGAERVASNLSLNLPGNKYDKHIIVYDDEKIDYPYKG